MISDILSRLYLSGSHVLWPFMIITRITYHIFAVHIFVAVFPGPHIRYRQIMTGSIYLLPVRICIQYICGSVLPCPAVQQHHCFPLLDIEYHSSIIRSTVKTLSGGMPQFRHSGILTYPGSSQARSAADGTIRMIQSAVRLKRT